MDNKRMFLAIAVSLAILLGWQYMVRPHLPAPPPAPITHTQAPAEAASQAASVAAKPVTVPGLATDAGAAPMVLPKNAPRVDIAAPRVQGSISLIGARLDDLVLRDYHETISHTSPLVRLLEPAGALQPTYIQFGWSAKPGQKVILPTSSTLWKSSGGPLAPGKPVTLRWDNGAGLIFQIRFGVDDNYMFTIDQSVHNASGAPVSLYPWSRISRDYTPATEGNYLLHEGLLGVLHGTLQEYTYSKTKSDGKGHDGVAYTSTGDGGWSGITDKYWLVALVPDQKASEITTFRQVNVDHRDGYQVSTLADKAETVAPGATSSRISRVFAGAKVVRLLDQYETKLHIPSFDKAVDFGWFYFLTKPIFYALDWLNTLLGNFGLAIMAFTVCVKLLFFPLANRSYRSMSRMRLLAPKMQAIRARLKEEPARQQQEIMALYKSEGVNPASGCLPMLLQIPVFFCLYKDIFVTIEMRHAPFFLWIHDLSAIDPTNVFNLFGLLPFHPGTISPFLHLGILPIFMGFTMWLQQRLNPPPPDPMQAKLFQFMPLIFTFMLARFPAGLVIYWSWNNMLTAGQQWLIMRQTKLAPARPART